MIHFPLFCFQRARAISYFNKLLALSILFQLLSLLVSWCLSFKWWTVVIIESSENEIFYVYIFMNKFWVWKSKKFEMCVLLWRWSSFSNFWWSRCCRSWFIWEFAIVTGQWEWRPLSGDRTRCVRCHTRSCRSWFFGEAFRWWLRLVASWRWGGEGCWWIGTSTSIVRTLWF